MLNTNATFAHKWGSPWVDDLGIFLLTDNQKNLLHTACEKTDVSILKTKIFDVIWNNIENYIKVNGPVFFRISTISPKDVCNDDLPLCYANNVTSLFTILVKSCRVIEDLENDYECAIILKKWNYQIKKDREYRCLIIDRKCEAISKMSDCSEPSTYVNDILENYIVNNQHLFPEDNVALDVCVTDDYNIIFIEFNPVDDELDTFDILKRGTLLSERAMIALNSYPKF